MLSSRKNVWALFLTAAVGALAVPHKAKACDSILPSSEIVPQDASKHTVISAKRLIAGGAMCSDDATSLVLQFEPDDFKKLISTLPGTVVEIRYEQTSYDAYKYSNKCLLIKGQPIISIPKMAGGSIRIGDFHTVVGSKAAAYGSGCINYLVPSN